MTQDEIGEYASWTEPGTSFQVHYSLPVFHEIDFTVSEGYRRIPHGGIEVGGLLLGRRFSEGVRIEAFRQINCEHALGPSFKLSERDISELREQIAQVSVDPELGGWETLGWFIAHTRGPLQMTESEARQFDDLLPGAGMLTLLVKPEKFKPTLFTFLVRRRDGTVTQGGVDRAVILPLPGRTGQSPIATAPIAAVPEETSARPVELPKPPPIRPPDLAPFPIPRIEPLSIREQSFAEERSVREEPIPIPAKEPEPTPGRPALVDTPSMPVAPRPEPEPISIVRPRHEPAASSPALSPPPFEWKFDRTPVEESLFGQPMRQADRREARKAVRDGNGAGALVRLLLVAAILGLGAGFWMYRQMAPVVIPLTVEPEANGVLVSWPPEQTSNAAHAYVRVNDGSSVELPVDAKSAGKWEVTGSPDNLKFEIIVQHAFHNSRGIVRFVEPWPGHQ
jgi:hypothetical protein